MNQKPTMTPTSTPDVATTRRQLLRTGAIGAAATAFLAACGGGQKSPSGLSGIDPTTTLVTPTVPVLEPSQADLDYDTTVLRTATSLELVVAGAYAEFGTQLTDPALVATAARFGADHEANAEIFRLATPFSKRFEEPNTWVQENLIDSSASLMTNDRAILGLMEDLENMLAATLLDGVATATSGELRSSFGSIAAASARRSALLGAGGAGTAPSGALFANTDLISNDAYLPADAPATEGAG